MRLLKQWTEYRTRRLATIALSEQLNDCESAFFAGAQAALTEINEIPGHRDDAVSDMIVELEARRRDRGERT